MFGSRDQRKGSGKGERMAEEKTGGYRGEARLARSLWTPDQVKRRRQGAREEREVGSGVMASDKQRRDSQTQFANGFSRDSSPFPPSPP